MSKKLQANSGWLYIVPWGMYKAVTYVKERYGNPNVIVSENGKYIFRIYIKKVNYICKCNCLLNIFQTELITAEKWW